MVWVDIFYLGTGTLRDSGFKGIPLRIGGARYLDQVPRKVDLGLYLDGPRGVVSNGPYGSCRGMSGGI